MNTKKDCPVCGSKDVLTYESYDPMHIFYDCPVCGRYEFDENELLKKTLNFSKLRHFLFHKGFRQATDFFENRYFTTLEKEQCDELSRKQTYFSVDGSHPVHFDNDMIEDWYPRSFAEKNDKVLLKLYDLADYVGDVVSLSETEFISCFFVDMYKKSRPKTKLTDKEMHEQATYYAEYLRDNGYIIIEQAFAPVTDKVSIKLTSKGYLRVDELQKNTGNGRNALVAMKFGDDTNQLREAIKQGIREAGYIPILIDEVEHNELITPELLSHIRNSKFIVVDLSHQNNGAYFEEGYAMGLGKPVIQLCKKNTKLHFDIAQKNTIIWEKEDDIPLRLKNRIKATID